VHFENLWKIKPVGCNSAWAKQPAVHGLPPRTPMLHAWHSCCLPWCAAALLCFALPCRALLGCFRCFVVQAVAPLALVPCCAACLRCPAALPLAPELALKPHLFVQPCRAAASVKSHRRVWSQRRVFPHHLFIDRRPRSHATHHLLLGICSVLPPGVELSIRQDSAMPCLDSPSCPKAICVPHANAPVSTSTLRPLLFPIRPSSSAPPTSVHCSHRARWAAASSHPRHRPHAPWSVSNRAILVLCSQRRAEDRSGTLAAFDVLHRQAPHHRRATSGTKPTHRHLLQHPINVLLLTDISSGTSDLPSGLPPLSTSAACTPPWTANPGEPPSFPTPQISPPRHPGPPSPLLTSPRHRHHLDSWAAASLAWPHAMARRAPIFRVGFSAQCKADPLSWARLKANGRSDPSSAIS
jgi:hypothetical protein